MWSCCPEPELLQMCVLPCTVHAYRKAQQEPTQPCMQALPEENMSSQPSAEIAPRGIEALRRPPKPPQPTAALASFKPNSEGMAAPMPYASPFECMHTACFNGSSTGSHDNDEITDDNDSTHGGPLPEP